MDDIIVSQNNNAIVQPEAPERVHEQAPVLIQENILQDGGIAATITVGTTTTLDPDSAAYVRNVGDEKHAVLQFGIPKGETGVSGVDGTDGQAATIQIGSVETVDSSSDAAVENVGTENAAVLNFSIPRGKQGIQGEQGYSPVAYVVPIQDGARIHIVDSQTETDVDVMNGQDGADGQSATITVGSTTTGAAGTNASVVNSGTSSSAVLDFTIPRGADGQDGQDGADGHDGADGQAATITVGSTTTGAAGTNASVVNSGTSSAAVLDFVIPRGADGQNGQNGTDGNDGFSPIATVSQGTGSATITITDANGTTTATVYDGTTPDTSVSTYSLNNTPAHSGGTNTITIRKQLSVVSMNIQAIWTNSVSTSWTTIGTISSDIVPTVNISCAGTVVEGNNGSVVAYGKVQIQTDGNVRFRANSAYTGLSAYGFSASWII